MKPKISFKAFLRLSKPFKALGIILLFLAILVVFGDDDNTQRPVRSGEWTTLYEIDYNSNKVEPFEFHPDRIEEGKIYPDHPCTIAKVSRGKLITTTIDRQECFISGYNTTLLTHWSDVAMVTYNEDYIFPHPALRMTAKFMFPKDVNEEYYFHMNPEIFTDKDRGNYNIFGQIRISNKGKIIYIGEGDMEITMPLTIGIRPDTWYDVVMVVDMQTREYLNVTISGPGATYMMGNPDFKSKFTKREDNGMDDFRPYMGFWIGTNLPLESLTTDGQDVYIDYFKIEVMQ